MKNIILSIILSSLPTGAESLVSFSEVWNRVQEKSFAIQSEAKAYQSTEVATNRALWHWAPSLYIEAKSFLTDDPGAILFSKLGERNITGEDFSPLVMNFPDRERHEKLTLGVDWKLYEGGQKFALQKGTASLMESRTSQLLAQKVTQYSRALGLYSQLLILERKKQALLPLQNIVDSTISKYQLGSSSNPLGHSGLLGLKNLKNRIFGELAMIESQKKSVKTQFQEWLDTKADILPAEKSTLDLLSIYVDEKVSEEPSWAVQSQTQASQGYAEFSEAEKARFLPQIGLFAEQNIYNQTESTMGQSQTTGVYLKWYFSMENANTYKESLLKAQAMELAAQELNIYQKTRSHSAKINIEALKGQIELADKSLKLLEEQSQVTRKLFNSGLINALQLSEVYARRVDVIIARDQMEKGLLQNKLDILNSNKVMRISNER